MIYHWLALVTCLSSVAIGAWLRLPATADAGAPEAPRSIRMRRRSAYTTARGSPPDPVPSSFGGDGFGKPRPRWGRA